MAFSVEKFVRVCDDKDGCYWQIGPDRDGLDLVELSYNDGRVDPDPDMHSFTMPIEVARKFSIALKEFLDDYDRCNCDT